MEKRNYDESLGLYQQFIMPTYAPKIMFTRGAGVWLWDADERRYLDFASGISVCNLGHCHPKVTRAVQEQVAKLVHVSNIYFNDVTPQLAEKICSRSFDGVLFFSNSGAEANEGLIKFARKHGSEKGRNEIVTAIDSFHGRTLATLAATGRAKYRQGFGPDMPGFKNVPFNDFAALEAAVDDKCCAVMLEPVQGEGGLMPADKEYLQKVRQLCDERGILLLFDEVQCGMGRLGTMFAHESFGVVPDAFSMAKAIANGLPMGAFVVKRQYGNTLQVGTHGSTFGGTPLVSAAALAVQNVFDEENIFANCVEQGKYMRERLEAMTAPYSFVKGIRGMGLMLGIALDHSAAALSALMLQHNLLTLTAGETVLRMLPPLNITRSELDEGLDIVEATLKEYAITLEQEKKES